MTSLHLSEPLPRVFNKPDHKNCKSLYSTIILPAEDAAVRLWTTSHTKKEQLQAGKDIIALHLVRYLLI